MAKTTTLRDIPESLWKSLTTIARRERRSMNGQILYFLEQAVHESETNEATLRSPITELAVQKDTTHDNT